MSRAKKIIISCFIVFHLLIMARVLLPLEKPFFQSIYRPIDTYLSFFSLYQNWTMFAPNPSRINVYLTAEVDFIDGTKDSYTFPRSSMLSLEDRFSYGERYRVISDVIRKDSNYFLWTDVAKFALRKLKENNFHKLPARVRLRRHMSEIPDVKTKFIPHQTQNTAIKSKEFFSYEVL